MSTELSILKQAKSLVEAKQAIKDWKPANKEQAGLFLLMRSIISGKAGEAAKKAANAFLLERCKDCEVHEFEGFQLKKVNKTATMYTETKEIVQLTKDLEEAQAVVEELTIRLNAEIELNRAEDGEKTFSHWLVQ